MVSLLHDVLTQVGKELGGGHQGAVYELLDGKGKDSGQVLKVGHH